MTTKLQTCLRHSSEFYANDPHDIIDPLQNDELASGRLVNTPQIAETVRALLGLTPRGRMHK